MGLLEDTIHAVMMVGNKSNLTLEWDMVLINLQGLEIVYKPQNMVEADEDVY